MYMKEQQPIHFRDKVKTEAKAQKELKASGKPIPPELKKYARLSGVIMILGSGAGLGLLIVLAKVSGFSSVGISLFFGFFMLLGVAQVITGRHFLAKRH